ncbi:MAG: nucleotidyltransferase domain-containing protein [Dactylosporangium sp.]|nr:nucleotidyltransferase domain-containing protein [Dactylosporangium sp.]NNJ60154.1 nucleotidyltransferase domain-containing protein [Dactylosporangium sp.]
MHRDQPPTREPTGLSPERVTEVEGIIDRVTRWAAHRHDVVGLLLVGSCVRNAALPDSDIDLVLLTTDQDQHSVSTAAEKWFWPTFRERSWFGATAPGVRVCGADRSWRGRTFAS